MPVPTTVLTMVGMELVRGILGFLIFLRKFLCPRELHAGGEGWWDQGPGGTVVQVCVGQVRLYLCSRPCLLSLKRCPGEGTMVHSLCVV